MDRHDVKFSIRKKILGVTLVAALPFLTISIYLLISMSNYNHTYNKIVQNLTIANNYNLDLNGRSKYLFEYPLEFLILCLFYRVYRL